jgi:hypothetical protein
MAGVGYRLKVAFDKYSDRYRIRQARGEDSYIKYPYDIAWMGNNTLVNQLYDEADIIHISEYPWIINNSMPKIWNPAKKPTVIHQHGTPFRSDPKKFLKIAKDNGYEQIVSTVDLLYDDSLTWIPNPVDIDMMLSIRKDNYVDDGIVRLGHAPTNRSIKNTAEFLAAIPAGADTVLIESQPWATTLREKARCDIWYDQLTFGYGNNGIEAGAMGIPIVGGFSDATVGQKIVDEVGFLPITPATVRTLSDVLRILSTDAESRERFGQLALRFMQDVHSEPVVVRRLEAVYDRI